MKNGTLEFDEASHTYRVDGRKVPGVTEVIRAFSPGFQASDWHKQRGIACHAAIALSNLGKLDWKSVDPAIAGRVRAWEKFRRDFGGTVIAVEKKLAHDMYLYAGTLDAAIERKDGIVVVDAKSTVEDFVVWQLAAYAMLFTAKTKRSVRRVGAVRLADDEKYQCTWFDEREIAKAARQFLGMVTTFNALQEYGITKGDR